MKKKILFLLIGFISMFVFIDKTFATDYSLLYDTTYFNLSESEIRIKGFAVRHNFNNVNPIIKIYFEDSSGSDQIYFNVSNTTDSLYDWYCTRNSDNSCSSSSFLYTNVGFDAYLNLNDIYDSPSFDYDKEYVLKIQVCLGSSCSAVEDLGVFEGVVTGSNDNVSITYSSTRLKIYTSVSRLLASNWGYGSIQNGSVYWGQFQEFNVVGVIKGGSSCSSTYTSYSYCPNLYQLSYSPIYGGCVRFGINGYVSPGTSCTAYASAAWVKPNGQVRIKFTNTPEDPEPKTCHVNGSSSQCSTLDQTYTCPEHTITGTGVYIKDVTHSDSGECPSTISTNIDAGSYSCTSSSYSVCTEYEKDENGNDTSVCKTTGTAYSHTEKYKLSVEVNAYQDLKVVETTNLSFSGDGNTEKKFKKGTGFTFGLDYSDDISISNVGEPYGSCYSVGSDVTWEVTCSSAISTARKDFIKELKDNLSTAIDNVKSSVKDGNYTTANPDPLFSSAGSWSECDINSSSSSVSTSCSYSLNQAYIKYDTGDIAYDKGSNSKYIKGENKYYIPMKFEPDSFNWKVIASNLMAFNTYSVDATCKVNTTTGLYCDDIECPKDQGYAFAYKSIEESDPFPRGESTIPANWEENWDDNEGRVAASFSGNPHYITAILSDNLINSLISIYDKESYKNWNNISSSAGNSDLVSDSSYFVKIANRPTIHCKIGEFISDCDQRY